MKFTEKLKRLTDGANKSKLARDAGLSATAITDYLQKGYVPRIDNALALARALKVPLEWLSDDAQEWPPPATIQFSPSQLSDTDLMREVCRRYRTEAIRLLEAVKRAESMAWDEVAEKFLSRPLDAPEPTELKLAQAGLLAMLLVNLPIQTVARYNASEQARAFNGQIPGAGYDPEELTDHALLGRYLKLEREQPGIKAIQEWAELRNTFQRFPEERRESDERRLELLDEVKRRAEMAKGRIAAVEFKSSGDPTAAADAALKQVQKQLTGKKPPRGRKG